jgi:hypothetical protein
MAAIQSREETGMKVRRWQRRILNCLALAEAFTRIARLHAGGDRFRMQLAAHTQPGVNYNSE